jgi:hypothetical protein
MIALILLIFCAIYFLYLKKWAESLLLKEYNFGSPSPPKPLPHSPTVSVIIGILWGVLLLAGVFWGFTFNRYTAYMSVHSNDVEIALLFILCFAIGLSYCVIYRMGEINGVAQMKKTVLFQTYIQEKDDERATWLRLSGERLAEAYGEEEEHSLDTVKEADPENDGR